MNDKIFTLNATSPIDFFIQYSALTPQTHVIGIDAHMHDKCEIYINLTGDISFMVEGNIYQVKRGSAIITKPGEWHHCIYNSEDEHKLFWILFSPEGNERLFTKFLERKSGENNLICLSEKNSEALIEICRKLLHSPLSEVKKYMLFFELISYIEDANDTAPTGNIPCDVKDAISFINSNISSKITINQLASHSLVSIKTLERHFIQYLKMSPADYTRYKKLITSAEMLQSGKSVTESAMDCGFCDTSNFICNFKKYFKMTPLEYNHNHQ